MEWAMLEAAMKSPTARTLAYYRKLGCLVGVTEHYNAFTKRRHDLFGFVDCIAVGLQLVGVIAIQCTSASNHAARVAKIVVLPEARRVLEAGNHIHVVSWRNAKPRGGRRVWIPRVQEITLVDMPAASCGSA